MPTKQRRRREQQRHDRDTRLRQQLRLCGELLCESHDDRKILGKLWEPRAILGRMMRTIGELVREPMDDSKRASLAAIFDQSKWREEGVTEVSYDGNMIHLSGEFDMRELAKRMVWIDVAEHEKVVMEEEYE